VLATALSVVPDDWSQRCNCTSARALPRTTIVVLGSRERDQADQTPSRWVALKRDLLIAIRSRFGADRTGRGFAWLYEYDAGSMDALGRDSELAATPVKA
jgi:hypothetical protein